MAECREGCGRCCDPVILSGPAIDLALNPRISPRERKWFLDDLRAMPRKEAKEKVPWAFNPEIAWMGQDGERTWPAFYRCRHFDEETRRCQSHDDLPETCEGFPWFDSGPHPAKVLPPECSYNEDVGRPVQLIRKPGT